ncbi:MAG: PEP-CTERM sorting domain-containing protein [Armatimonadetes bacterium]|nr:PEP-CTERM sorting domain-containing protein [Armatimonadota bacterium]
MNKTLTFLGLAAAIICSGGLRASAAVNLELRPITQTANIGETLGYDLYALSTTGSDEFVSAMDVILTWDPALIRPEVGTDGMGAPQPEWDFDGLLYQASGINNRDMITGDIINDGAFMYTAAAPLGTPVAISPTGLKIVEFRFTARAMTSGTSIQIPAAFGQDQTRVFDGMNANTDIKGLLTGARMTVVPEPSGLLALATGAVSLLGLIRRPRV